MPLDARGFTECVRWLYAGSVADSIDTVGEILLCHAGSVKKMGAGLYIVTEDEGATVGTREGENIYCYPKATNGGF